MVDKPDLIELTETEFNFLVNKAHKSGLSYREIRQIVRKLVKIINTQIVADDYLRNRK